MQTDIEPTTAEPTAPTVGDTGAPAGGDDGAGIQTEPAAPSGDTQTYKVKVDGQEIEVTLEEALGGYMRQADYTRKTQELSRQAQQLSRFQALAAALESDPEGTLRSLADAYRVNLGGELDNEVEDLDPLEQKVLTLEQRLAEKEAAEQQRAIDAALSNLHDQFGEFNEDELFAFALSNNITDLDAAFFLWKKDELLEKARQEAIANARRTEDDEKVRAAKAGLQTIEGGSHASATSQAPQPKTIREAFAMALSSSS